MPSSNAPSESAQQPVEQVTESNPNEMHEIANQLDDASRATLLNLGQYGHVTGNEIESQRVEDIRPQSEYELGRR